MAEVKLIVENNIAVIKRKITEIRRIDKTKVVSNYFNNCDESTCIKCLYGEKTVVFWNDDEGVVRVYFYSCDMDELVSLLKYAPKESSLEYITKSDNIIEELALEAGYKYEYTMQRFESKKLTEEEKKDIEEYWDAIKEAAYIPGLAYVAKESDLEDIYAKIFEIFNPHEAHACSKKKFLEYINNGWVSIARRNGVLVGFEVFVVEAGYRNYGYLLWSGEGPDTLCNLQLVTRESYKNYLRVEEERLGRKIVPLPAYAWVNMNNRTAKRNIVSNGAEFCGLKDFGYCKVTDGIE